MDLAQILAAILTGSVRTSFLNSYFNNRKDRIAWERRKLELQAQVDLENEKLLREEMRTSLAQLTGLGPMVAVSYAGVLEAFQDGDSPEAREVFGVFLSIYLDFQKQLSLFRMSMPHEKKFEDVTTTLATILHQIDEKLMLATSKLEDGNSGESSKTASEIEDGTEASYWEAAEWGTTDPSLGNHLGAFLSELEEMVSDHLRKPPEYQLLKNKKK